MFSRLSILLVSVAGISALIGCSRAVDEADLAAAETVVRIEVTASGFEPGEITLEEDAPAVLEFVRTAETTCVDAVVFPESGIRHELPLNTPVRVSVQPNAGQRIAFACPMDMYRGSVGTGAPETVASSIGTTDGVQEIRVDQKGFHPSRIHVAAGESTVLRFTRVAENTCNDGVLIPGMGIDMPLPLGEPVEIAITPDAAGDLVFSCPMNMATGVIEVTQGEGQ